MKTLIVCSMAAAIAASLCFAQDPIPPVPVEPPAPLECGGDGASGSGTGFIGSSVCGSTARRAFNNLQDHLDDLAAEAAEDQGYTCEDCEFEGACELEGENDFGGTYTVAQGHLGCTGWGAEWESDDEDEQNWTVSCTPCEEEE